MDEKKYLLIVQTYKHADIVGGVFDNIKNDVGFTIDLVVKEGRVLTESTGMLLLNGNMRDEVDYDTKKIRGVKVKKGTSIITNKTQFRRCMYIKNKVQENRYDAIVNCLSKTKGNELLFGYMLDRADIPMNYPTKRLPMPQFGDCDEKLISTLLKQLPIL